MLGNALEMHPALVDSPGIESTLPMCCLVTVSDEEARL
jgi:hypothetical protein